MTSQELIDFEREVADLFEQGKIRAPIHLSKGNECDLIRIFKQIKSTDWVCSTHRSHYHALLKGISKEWLKNEILQGRSITICSREHRFITSAIVGGILPIALGLAMTGQTVWCFVGDMASETGIFHECVKYAIGHKLPIVFVVEDNGYSVDTPTEQVWRYSYTKELPHQGVGRFVEFG
jgi:TPP-dependent pyruvate/acetoin dehydrogenase alpha subunit